MTNELGRNTQQGFLPAEPRRPANPRAANVFEQLGLLQDGFEGLKKNPAAVHLAEALENPQAELLRSYARFHHGTANSADQKAIMEDLLNQTLRRGHMHWQQGWTLEQYTAHGLHRSGQDYIVIYLMKMMQDGLDLPAPTAKKTKKKSR